MAPKDIALTQMNLFEEIPDAALPQPVDIVEDWRGIGSFFIATEEDAASGDMVIRPKLVEAPPVAEGEQAAEAQYETVETPPVPGELLVLGLHGPEMPRVPLRHQERIRHLIQLSDAARRLLYAQRAMAPKFQIKDLRAELNRLYDAFVAKYGAINTEARTAHGTIRRPNLLHFDRDPNCALVAALEVDISREVVAAEPGDEDEETQSKTREKQFAKAAIFSRDTVGQDKEPSKADTPRDALNISLDRKGAIDVAYIAKLLGTTKGEAIEALSGDIFQDPVTKDYELAATYLSGQVRRKLLIAREAAEKDPKWQINVSALEAVQPDDLTPEDILPAPGAPWIPADDIRDFIIHLLDCKAKDFTLVHIKAQADWLLRAENKLVEKSARSRSTWGTSRMNAFRLIECALDQTDPVVRDRIPFTDPPKYVVNREATLLAREKLQEIKQEFTRWLWSDHDRAVRLCRVYNDMYNDVVETRYDGSHLTLPGADTGVTPHGHQKDAIWRGIQSRNTLLAHKVGYGKTWEQAAIIMESKRLGHAKKPVWVVPNNMIEDIPRQFLHLYPMARLLVAGKGDMSPDQRKEFFARIATSDMDCVIMTHDQLQKLPLSVTAKREFLEMEIADLEERIEGADPELEKSRARALRNRREDLKLLKTARNHGLTFEDTGIDMMVVDEAHVFKSIPIVSKNRNLEDPGSLRARDLVMRVRHINTRGGKVVFATGTPITNSILEVYGLQYYLAYERLRDLGIRHADAWIATFADAVTRYEMGPAGNYEAKTRFASFRNVPELRSLLREFADVKMDTVKEITVPEIEGGERQVIAIEPNEWQQAFFDDLLRRIEILQGVREPDPVPEPAPGDPPRKKDHILLVVNDARMASLDPRLIDLNADATGGKLEALAKVVARVYHDTKEEGAVQHVFCDIRHSRTGFDVYEAFRNELEKEGVDPGKVAFAQDASGKGAKRMLDDAINAGEIAVVLGSTPTLGQGRNIQKRAIAQWHLDVPWRPIDVEQRVGRIIRQGNRYKQVKLGFMVTKRSPDGFVCSTVERKGIFSHEMLAGTSKRRTLEDIDPVVLSMKTAKATISDDPLKEEKETLEARIMRLEVKVREGRKKRYSDREELAFLPAKRAAYERRLSAARLDLAERVDTSGDAFVFDTGGDMQTKRVIAGEVLKKKYDRAYRIGTSEGSAREEAGSIGGFKVFFEKIRGSGTNMVLKRNGEYKVELGWDDYTRDGRGLVARAENMIARLDKEVADLEMKLEMLERDRAVMEANVSGHAPDEDELQKLYTRLAEVDAELGIGVVEADVHEDAEGEKIDENGENVVLIDDEEDVEEEEEIVSPPPPAPPAPRRRNQRAPQAPAPRGRAARAVEQAIEQEQAAPPAPDERQRRLQIAREQARRGIRR